MSSGADTSDDLECCLQTVGDDTENRSVAESSIFYLLQEATKLATSSNEYSPLAEGLQSKEETVPTYIPCNTTPITRQNQKEIQPSFTGTFTMQASSPWEVMSLINLQCERLLHCEQINIEDVDVYPCDKCKTNDLEDAEVLESSSLASDVPHSSTESSREDAHSVYFSVPHDIDNTDQFLSDQTVDEHDCAKTEAIEDLAELISKNTAGFNSEESTENSLLVETSSVPLDAANVVEDQTRLHPQRGEPTCSTTMSAAHTPSPVDFTSSLVDENDGSLCFDFHACEGFCSAEVSKVTPQSPRLNSASVSRTDLNNNLEDKNDEKHLELEEEQAKPSAQTDCENRRRTPRKQAHPSRSPDLHDPEIQGVTFSMHTELDSSTDQCRLLITSKYRRGRRSRITRSRSLQISQRTSSSEEESDSVSISKKVCASCCTRKTPLWRDAEDGTPLCNACGIRYKKYRVRCLQCWNIPRKEANSNSKCLKCGDLLQLASQNKRS
ncbi:GATA-type zinc finger protein 1 [Hoplias malabaricus]|uniref:GATA-type zinc finger protein 1 n=1 Tax=Hoplias malabaricus TaxID=27720 RepID=UPI003463354F